MNSNVYPLRPFRPALHASRVQMGSDAGIFDALTDHLLMQQAEAGTLNPAIVAALLAAVRQSAPECGR